MKTVSTKIVPSNFLTIRWANHIPFISFVYIHSAIHSLITVYQATIKVTL